MKKILAAAVTVFAFSAPSLSHAAPAQTGPYVSGFLGVSSLSDTTISSFDFPTSTAYTEKLKFDPGLYLGAAAGYDYGAFRLEGEMSYRGAKIDSINSLSSSYSIYNADGDISAVAVMFNTFVDLHNSSPVTPYLGGGVGFATVSLSNTYGVVRSSSTTSYELLYHKNDDTVFAYQVGGGVDIALNRNLSIDVGYRYFRTENAHFDAYYTVNDNIKFESHDVVVGMKMKF